MILVIYLTNLVAVVFAKICQFSEFKIIACYMWVWLSHFRKAVLAKTPTNSWRRMACSIVKTILQQRLKFMFDDLTFGTNRIWMRHKRAVWLLAKAMPAEMLFHRPQG